MNSLVNSSTLIEDLHLNTPPPIAGNVSQGSFRAVQDHGQPGKPYSLITVSPVEHQQNPTQISRYFRTSASISGWDHEVVLVDGAPDNVPIETVATFYCGDGKAGGALYLLALYPRSGGKPEFDLHAMVRQPGEEASWEGVDFSRTGYSNLFAGAVHQLDVHQSMDGTAIIYGVVEPAPGNTSLFFLTTGKSSDISDWTANPFEYDAGATYKMLAPKGDGDPVVAKCGSSTIEFLPITVGSDGVVNVQTDGIVTWKYGDLNDGDAIGAADLIAPPECADSQGCLLLAKSGALYAISGYGVAGGTVKSVELTSSAAGPVSPVPGGTPGNITRVVSGVDSTGLCTLLAADQTNTLWQLVQGSTDEFAFGSWTLLGDVVSLVACPANMTSGSEAFYYDGTRAAVCYIAKDPATTLWHGFDVAIPYVSGSKTYKQSHELPNNSYSHQIILQDENENPLRSSAIEITTDRKAIVEVSGVTYHTGPSPDDAIRDILTDAEGKITVSSRATGLLSPKITATASQAGVTSTFSADSDVHNRLAGNDKSFPITADSLHSGGVLATSVTGASAKKFATNVTKIASTGLNQKSAGMSDAAPTCHMMVREGDSLNITELPEAEFDRAAGDAGSVWSDIGDAIHWLEKAAKTVGKVLIKVLSAEVHFIVQLDKVFYKFVTKTLEDTFKGLESLFAWSTALIKAEIDFVEDLMKFLRLLFEWKNVLVTKTLFKETIHAGLTAFQSEISTVTDAILTEVKKGEAAANKDFDALLQKLMPKGRKMGDSAPKVRNKFTGPGNNSPMAMSGYNSAHNKHAMRMSYVKNKAQQNPPHNSSAIALSLGGQGGLSFDEGIFDDIINKIENDPGVKQTLSGLGSFFKNEKIKSFKDLLDAAAYTFLSIFKLAADVAFDVVEGIIKALKQFAEAVIGALLNVITNPIQIPVVSDIYEIISGSKLTLLDLFSLIGAVPTTLIYELFTGKPPFTADSISKIVDLVKAKKWIPGSATAFGAVLDSDRTVKDLSLAVVFGGVVLTVFDSIGFGLAANDKEIGGWLNIFVTLGANLMLAFVVVLSMIAAGISNAGGSGPKIPLSLGIFGLILLASIVLSAREKKHPDLAYGGPLVLGSLGVIALTFAVVDASLLDVSDPTARDLTIASLILAPIAPTSLLATLADGKEFATDFVMVFGIISQLLGDAVSPILAYSAILSEDGALA